MRKLTRTRMFRDCRRIQHYPLPLTHELTEESFPPLPIQWVRVNAEINAPFKTARRNSLREREQSPAAFPADG